MDRSYFLVIKAAANTHKPEKMYVLAFHGKNKGRLTTTFLMDYVRHVTKKCLQINEFPSLMKFMYSILEIISVLSPRHLGQSQKCYTVKAHEKLYMEYYFYKVSPKKIVKPCTFQFSAECPDEIKYIPILF